MVLVNRHREPARTRWDDLDPQGGTVDITPGNLKLACAIHYLPGILSHSSLSY